MIIVRARVVSNGGGGAPSAIAACLILLSPAQADMELGAGAADAKDEKLAVSTFNARADTIDTKPAFRDAWRSGKRCLVVTDGFYQWNKRHGAQARFSLLN